MRAIHSIARLTAAGALTAGLLGAAAVPATGQPLVVGGLVNVVITDVIDDVTVVVEDVNVGVAAALALAANVCDVNVNVLAVQLRNDSATCTNEITDQTVTLTQA